MSERTYESAVQASVTHELIGLETLTLDRLQTPMFQPYTKTEPNPTRKIYLVPEGGSYCSAAEFSSDYAPVNQLRPTYECTHYSTVPITNANEMRLASAAAAGLS